ncbi:carboxypeptidase-like protein [Hymenobacter chitinivorans DSM 11115]|uniref:Carboxypeptidase-like protein n=1 Tax=Hymenobacter chitinivorans DSM 11115 TaxID=1121954 RepID=A0A2M9B4G8_9BACT|nr:carboxypeptidase-like regulatory domain-containing protein [Hymenobacter chitinivorans]PJJ52826.1 carboxypeptidase-like protein [Hymenobacter chitinivorans DSM 11115]
MRPSAVSLRISEPCAQPWALMTPQGAGRHCAACQKVVIDFTQKTDAEILAVLAATAGQACGRFGGSQLNRPLQPLVVAPPRAGGWWRPAVAATVALLGFRTLLPQAAQAQHPTSQHPSASRRTDQPESRAEAKPVDRDERISDNSRLLTGRVVDKTNGEGVPGVTVLVKGTTNGVSTNSDGTFSLRVAADQQNLLLTFATIGYLYQELPMPTGPQAQNMHVGLNMEVLGGVWYSPIYTPRGVWQRLSSVPRRVWYAFQRD